MAATEKKNMWFWSSDDGKGPQVVTRKIAASQGVFMPGAPCYITTAGTVKLAATTAGSDAWHGFIVGLADQSTVWPITGELAVNTEIRVALIKQQTLYAVYLETGGTDIAAAQTHVGDQLGLVVSSTAGEVGYTTCDVADTTNVAVEVVDIATNVDSDTYGAADNPGVAIVRFLNSVIQAAKA